MFIKKLIISTTTIPSKILREIEFKMGLNLIIDDTPELNISSSVNVTHTGNNLGKTTVLKLIDFCLGAKTDILYTNSENEKIKNTFIFNFLTQNKISITLILTSSLITSNSKDITICRTFSLGKKQINGEINEYAKIKNTIDGIKYTMNEFKSKLSEILYPSLTTSKPSFRELIPYNIRYTDTRLNNTIKILHANTTPEKYESILLFLLNCPNSQSEIKEKITNDLKKEKNFKQQLEALKPKNTYELALPLIEEKINKLEQKKQTLNVNERFEDDLFELNTIKFKISKCSSIISKLEIRKNLIENTKKNLEQSQSNINMSQLKSLYTEAKVNINDIQKTFEDLVTYHNQMLVEKINFITADLPIIKKSLKDNQLSLSQLLNKEKELSHKITKGSSYQELESIIADLNEQYKIKGEYEYAIHQINISEKKIDKLNAQLNEINNQLSKEDFKKKLIENINLFNKYFSYIAQELYTEQYGLTFNLNNKGYYEFNTFTTREDNINDGSGKKQGEILSFDIARILFNDEKKIPCPHFLLNDKKELMHNNQLIKLSQLVKDLNIQLIIPILKDKLPKDIFNYAHIALELSEDDKLYRIESLYKNEI